MKKLLVIAFLFGLLAFQIPNVLFVVKPSFTDKQLLQIEYSLKTKYGIIAKIEVLKRDADGNIIHLKYEKNGVGGVGCESDNFGQLSIRYDGCGISDKMK